MSALPARTSARCGTRLLAQMLDSPFTRRLARQSLKEAFRTPSTSMLRASRSELQCDDVGDRGLADGARHRPASQRARALEASAEVAAPVEGGVGSAAAADNTPPEPGRRLWRLERSCRGARDPQPLLTVRLRLGGIPCCLPLPPDPIGRRNGKRRRQGRSQTRRQGRGRGRRRSKHHSRRRGLAP